MQAKREQWSGFAKKTRASQLVFLDESGVNINDVVVMDNLRTHHIQTVSELLHGAGAEVLYLPAYSPDLNPIEKLWSKVKAVLRKLRFVLPMHLMQLFALLLDLFPLMIVLGIVYFENCSKKV